jgi:hypothetical protein
MSAAKFDDPNDFLSEREKEIIRGLVDHAAIFDPSPNEFTEFDNDEQERLNVFIASLLTAQIMPKSVTE